MTNSEAPARRPDPSRYRHLLPRYRRYAPRYDEAWGRYSRATLGKVVELLDRHAPDAKTLLDVGCGTGLLASMLRPARPDLEITGIDLSEEMLEHARNRFAADGRTTWQVADAESLPVDDESFDVVVSANNFHMILDQEQALREYRRVLRRGGTLIIVDWNRSYWTIRLLAAIYPLVDRHPRRIETLDGLATRIRTAEFDVLEGESFRATPFWGMSAVVAHRGATVTTPGDPHPRAAH